MKVPKLPEKSTIKLGQDLRCIKLKWPSHTLSIQHLGYSFFLLFWLAGWAFIETIGITILSSGLDSRVFPVFIIWFTVWSGTGVLIITLIFKLLLQPKIESLILSKDVFLYKISPRPINLTSFQYQDNPFLNPFVVLQKSKAVKFKTKSIRNIKLTNTGDRYIITLTIAEDKIEIGNDLSIQEKKWLVNVLKTWKTQKT